MARSFQNARKSKNKNKKNKDSVENKDGNEELNNENNDKSPQKRKLDENSENNEEDVEIKNEQKRLKLEKAKLEEKEKKEKTLFVKSFPNEFTEDDLKNLSSDIINVKLNDFSSKNAKFEDDSSKSKKKNKKIKKTALLEFNSVDLAEKNFDLLKDKKFPNGQKLFVDYVGAKSTYKKQGFSKKAKGKRDFKRLHIKGFDKTIEEKDLKNLFNNCSDFFMQKKRDSNLNLGFAFVQYKSEDEAKKVQEQLNGKEFKGKNLIIDFAIERDESKNKKN